jgi:hypothetical protein
MYEYVFGKTESLRNHCHGGKAISITYILCVLLATIIQHAMRMYRVILSFVASLAQQHFFIFFDKGYNLKKKLLSLKCVF